MRQLNVVCTLANISYINTATDGKIIVNADAHSCERHISKQKNVLFRLMYVVDADEKYWRVYQIFDPQSLIAIENHKNIVWLTCKRKLN